MKQWIFLFLLAGVKAGPQDAFRANYAAIQVSLDFELSTGLIDYEALSGGRLWKHRGADVLLQNRRRTEEGQWECDGTAVRYEYKELKPEPDGLRKGEFSRFEILFDGLTTLRYRAGDKMVRASSMTSFPQATRVSGPFHLWKRPFPDLLKELFPNTNPERGSAVDNDQPTEVEIYRKELPGGGWNQLELHYDSALSYLYSYCRMTVYDKSKDSAIISEHFLIDHRPCDTGGIVPTEWIQVQFKVNNFKSLTKDMYNYNTLLKPSGRTVCQHFIVKRFKNRSGPVALRWTAEGARWLVTPGSHVAIPKVDEAAPLTLSRATALAGKGLTERPNRPLAHIDVKEARLFEQPSARSWTSVLIFLGIGLVVAALTGIGIRMRRVFLLLVLVWMTGCGEPVKPIVRLAARFSHPKVIVDVHRPDFQETLILTNSGSQPLRLFKIDGGCTCRKVDQHRLPLVLQPGGETGLTTILSSSRAEGGARYILSCETDQGTIRTPVDLFALPNHALSPSSTSASLDESEDWSFRMVHREVYPSGARPEPAQLDLHAEFVARQVGPTTSGKVAGVPEFKWRESHYEFTLKDQETGIRKAFVSLRRVSDGRELVQLPVVWQRFPFLSAVPNRIVLGIRPVRVFLRCPDPSVELKRVLSSPRGVKAVVSSIREVDVMLEEEAPRVIEGLLRVETTVTSRPPLEVPVVRYAPVSSR